MVVFKFNGDLLRRWPPDRMPERANRTTASFSSLFLVSSLDNYFLFLLKIIKIKKFVLWSTNHNVAHVPCHIPVLGWTIKKPNQDFLKEKGIEFFQDQDNNVQKRNPKSTKFHKNLSFIWIWLLFRRDRDTYHYFTDVLAMFFLSVMNPISQNSSWCTSWESQD